MEKWRRWEAESSTDEGYKKNDLTRTEGRNPVLARSLPLNKTLILDQAIADQLPQLILHGARSGPDLLRGPHGDKFLVLDHLEHLFLVH
jgi:hypothetical protein